MCSANINIIPEHLYNFIYNFIIIYSTLYSTPCVTINYVLNYKHILHVNNFPYMLLSILSFSPHVHMFTRPVHTQTHTRAHAPTQRTYKRTHAHTADGRLAGRAEEARSTTNTKPSRLLRTSCDSLSSSMPCWGRAKHREDTGLQVTQVRRCWVCSGETGRPLHEKGLGRDVHISRWKRHWLCFKART